MNHLLFCIGKDCRFLLTDYFRTASANYSQLWIYPSATTTVQYNLEVMNVALCPLSCSTTGTLVYNVGVVPANLSEAGQIYAGSSAGTGGSGTVSFYVIKLQKIEVIYVEY
jgi:hypothetical protein